MTANRHARCALVADCTELFLRLSKKWQSVVSVAKKKLCITFFLPSADVDTLKNSRPILFKIALYFQFLDIDFHRTLLQFLPGW